MNSSQPAAADGAKSLSVSTPGRICLFGEHQDYLNLPVIPCAISLRITLEGNRRSDKTVHISLPDTASEITFDVDKTFPYADKRDYFRSGINVLRNHGVRFSSGFECTVRGEIPVQAGTSSSSALVVSWIHFLSRMSDTPQSLSAEECARCAYEAEVLEFRAPGGMMDQYSVALGGVLFLKFSPRLSVEPLHPQLGTFVLGDSGEPKDTVMMLSGVRQRVEQICAAISSRHPGFSLQTVRLEDIGRFSAEISSEEFGLLHGTLRNRDITLEARQLLGERDIDESRFGKLLTEHQRILRDILHVSTPKIDRMLDAAMNAGALGGKINGSGGGGCMFAYAPENSESIAEAIGRAGGKPYIVHSDGGTKAL